MSKSIKEEFLKYIKSEDFNAAESLLASDIFDVEDQMEEISEEDYLKIEPHWSAVNTGEDIRTPLFVLKKIYDFIKFEDKSSIIDLGSGHGHPGFLFGILNPTLKILGYDIVLEKVNGAKSSAKRLELENVSFLTQDLSSEEFEIPVADYYYLFNPFNEEVADLVAEKLFKLAKKNNFKILSLDGWDIKSFKKAGFKKIASLDEVGLEVLGV